ncbi:CHASE2 domain-containing protein [Ekhidna lutea]|uniref:CHASE2 domain-containing protein n=1 Tax=Ekhidna lutea TaxID=447679 RepID=A0A239IVV0_EKHLU|nr:CHASE2 domain-containing protein [Ekhidna lutea]SNS97886.1 CHASE2 domain-containing protein [Ekhidna lutea]
MKRFIRDTILCSLFIFGIMGLFASVTLFKVFELFDPIGDMFSDFELTDIVFSQLQEDPIADERIVMVNIGNLPREGIARQIEIINQYEPKVIGLDVMLDAPKEWPEDSALTRVLSETPNIVIGEKLVGFDEETGEFAMTVKPEDHIVQEARLGYVNLITNAEVQEDLKMCREFTPSEIVQGETRYAFPVRLAYAYDSIKTEKFLARDNDIETVNYKGNIISFSSANYGMKYFALDVYDIFDQNFTADLFKDKIVIMCFMGEYIGDTETTEDFYFTPMNENYVGKAKNDMFGGVIHANIISQILDEDPIDQMSKNTEIVLAILFCLFNVFLFKIIYGAMPKWYDGITKIFQLIELMVLGSLMIYLLLIFNYKADFTLAMIVIALSGDSLEVYHGVVKNLFSKERRKEVFKINRRFWESQ